MNRTLSWKNDGPTWPNRGASRFLAAGGLTWHVQTMGEGPLLVLVHGTGASTHSWRDMLPLLARRFRVLAMDLPGHGFTTAPPNAGLTLPQMARGIEALLETCEADPIALIGHSAGAAIAARVLIDRPRPGAMLVSLNGALLPFNHMGAHTLPAAVKLLIVNPLSVGFATWRASNPRTVERLIAGTGSSIDPAGLALYGRLFRSAPHVAATLRMMANWELKTLERDLPTLKSPLLLVAGERDRAVPPAVAARVARIVAHARCIVQPGLGHLSHEERPQETAALIEEALTPAKRARA
jgi:magnesium chelatase accessory protein